MKAITSDWLRSANTDLETINAIIDNMNLTAIVAFHAQQCVEKCLKTLKQLRPLCLQFVELRNDILLTFWFTLGQSSK